MVTTTWSVYVTVIFLIFTFIRGIPAQSDNNGICGRMFIRNTPSDLMRLAGCKVIEGSLQIALISEGTPDDYKNYSFPLREITGYLLLYNAHGLQTLRHMFPNLTVIRGQEFIHNYYALLVVDMPDMQEIGLPALTNILQGKVWIYNNQNLCYLDTIDWGKITNDTHGNGIKKNKPGSQCPNTCPKTCPSAEQGYDLCWSNEDCQRVEMKTCKCDGGNCDVNGCCSDQCLGGCTGPGPHECYVCKNVEFNGRCLSECPKKTYMYLKRRCVTEDHCNGINQTDPSSKKILSGKLLEDRECVLECPKGHEEIQVNGASICRKCEGHCKKVCPGLMVDSVEASTQLKGCTRIQGSLKIQIRGYTSNLGTALADNLDMIEEIDDYLVVAYTYSLLSLNFFTNLKAIHGNKLEENTYALVVKSNENIANLWTNRTVKITNNKGRILFHYNPKLCPQKIREFVKQANITLPKDDRVDIGITNGDKVPCNQKKLRVKIQRKSNSSVTIVWENFLRNLTEPSHLLNYEVSYKEAPTDVSPYDDRDPCGNDDWKVLDVPKTQQAHVLGQEPEWEDEKLINNLKYYTRYGLYVKTVVIPDETSPNNNTGAESDVIYFVTLPDEPSVPTRLSVSSNSSSEVLISWYPPDSPNGELEVFEIYIRSVPEDVAFQDTRNYCEIGRVESKLSQIPESTTTSFMKELTSGGVSGPGGTSTDCCSCSGSSLKPVDPRDVQLETDIESAILNKVFIPNPDPIAYIGDGEHIFGQKRRRRRGVDENSQEIILFPGESRARDEPNGRRPGSDFNVTQVVPAIANDTSPHKRYEVVLRNLTHFTRYRIGVVACRKKSLEIENDTRICSEMVSDFVQTKPLPAADEINPGSVAANVSGSAVRVRWEEPPHPNGVVLAYQIQVRRVGKANDSPLRSCITRKKFQENGRNYTLPEKLQPGNYSLSIRTVSLAAESNYTIEKFFIIEDDDSATSTWLIVIAILLPILLLIFLAMLLGFYYIRTQKVISGAPVSSANPEYMSIVNIEEHWEIPRDSVMIEKEVGNGSFGKVYQGFVKDFVTGKPKYQCAIKTIFAEADSEDRIGFMKEAFLMTQISSHHLVPLIGVVSKTMPPFIVMELMLGDLKKYLRSRREGSEYSQGEPAPTLKEILRFAVEIADGMAYLDNRNYVHRDLAARNCMVGHDKTVRIGDFGMTRDIEETEYYRKESRGFLPIRWMAPESLRDGFYSSKTDTWSFGVVLWEMATLGAQPYQGLGNDQVLNFVSKGGIMEKPLGCPPQLYDIMHRCWGYLSKERPTFADILEWLTPSMTEKFKEVSFYHSPKGLEYRAIVRTREEVLITCKAPINPTYDVDGDLYEYDEDHDPSNFHIAYDCDNENGILLPQKACNGGLGSRVSYITGYPNTSRNAIAASTNYTTATTNSPTPAEATTATTLNNNRMQSSLQLSRMSNPNFVNIHFGNSNNDNYNNSLSSNGLTHRNVTARPTTLTGDRDSRGSPVFRTKFPSPSSLIQPDNTIDIVVPPPTVSTTSNNPSQSNRSSSTGGTVVIPSDSLKGLSISYSNESGNSNKLIGNGGTPNGETTIASAAGAGTTPLSNASGGHPTVPGTTSGVNGYVTLRRSPVTENYPKTQTTPL